ncbi:hypothetical protein DYBT9275_00935 [Dyadobacter sp. CECT 9275]|uniref:Uncharacterized protein n=1 Tax=Dyadobacter helix TaxID=2822344 RepID=A0A916J8E6_9BACT|nr:hypothetical protein [Dyadobacter sp. CECT 9275]CAG4992306.1 hypothetical protein DYBT9275_00935 [Dyadobacter sp. CECT 9275]
MLPRIEASQVMRRATQAFDAHNDACPSVSHKRRCANGEMLITRRQGIIPEAVTTTFHTLLTEYIHNYNRTREILPMEFHDVANPPALRTNAIRVAKYARCTDRTVRNHIIRLRELGFIQTKFHGSKRDFELWIAAPYLYGEAGTENAENSLKMALEGDQRKIFPHTSTHIEISEKEKGRADMLIMHRESIQGQRGETETKEQGLNAAACDHREKIPAAGGGESRAEVAAANHQKRIEKATAMLEARKPKGPKGLQSNFLYMLMEFWLYAWKVVYPNREFSKEQQEKALAAISAGVFENFQGDWTEKQWHDYFQVQMSKLDKAGRYYDMHPDAYRPDPYAVHIPGKGYFDAANMKGFIGIDAWMKKDAIRHARHRQDYADKQEAKLKRCEALLRTARRDFEKLRLNEKPRKEVSGKDQLALFQYYSVIFAGQGKKWQDIFCKQYLEQQARSFQAPAYMQPRKKRALAGEISKETIVYVEEFMQGDGRGYYSY